MAKEDSYFIGIDVGTGSARAAIIDIKGRLVSLDVQPIATYNPKHNIYEQSTDNIWSSICACVKNILAKAKLNGSHIKGIGFDATCSLVALNKQGQPQSVDALSGFTDHYHNVILWADHRAIEQANSINATQHTVLDYVGKTISPEMEVPKILWLKQNMPRETWDTIGHLMDLPDYLTHRATDSFARSKCSLTCKCSYVAGKGWDATFFEAIGLLDEHSTLQSLLGKLGQEDVLGAGEPIERGLSRQAARELGLVEGTPVGSAVIDAYAGALATLGATPDEHERETILNKSESSGSLNRLAIICGTSSCHIAMSPSPIFVPGVWGPYGSVMVPDMYCAEGGQSSVGQLIDFMVQTHPAYTEAQALTSKEGFKHLFDFLADHLKKLQQERGLKYVDEVTHDLHIYPDFHGNRSPLADPTLRGMVVGVSLDKSVDDLAAKYLATLQAIACQTRHIIETLNKEGYTIDTLCMSGGLCKSELFIQILVDTTQCRVILPESIEGAVVIGAAFLGVKASGVYTDLWETMVRLGRAGSTILPNKDEHVRKINERRYKVFIELLKDQKKYRNMMLE